MEQLSSKSAKYSRMGKPAIGVSHKRIVEKPTVASQETVSSPTLRARVRDKLAKFNLDKVLGSELSE